MGFLGISGVDGDGGRVVEGAPLLRVERIPALP